MTARVALTYRDYEALPNDGKRYEIHDGELSVTLAPTSRHQIVVGNLNEALRAHVKAQALGIVLFAPLDVILADTTIVQPDIVYLDPSRRAALVERGVEGPPTLAVEVLSPSTRTIDRQTKRQLYARYRVPYFWLVDPDAREIEVHELRDDAYVLAMRASGIRAGRASAVRRPAARTVGSLALTRANQLRAARIAFATARPPS